MSKRGRRLAGIAIALSALCATAAAQPTAPGLRQAAAPELPKTGTIRGQVVDLVTGRGIPRVALVLGDAQPASQVSDDTGDFVFTDVRPGPYTIQLSKPAYVSMQWPERRRGRRFHPIQLEPGATVDKLRIPLRRVSTIAGRVLDEFGDPAPDARVSLRTVASPNRNAVYPPGLHDVRTNDVGEFRLAPVEPGRYHLTARAGSGSMPSPRRPGLDRSGFVAWPQSPSPAGAEPLRIRTGEQLADIELRLFPTRPSSVTGIVLGVDGEPSRTASLTVGAALEGMTADVLTSSAPLRDGRFELSLAPGAYDLRAIAFDPPMTDAATGLRRQLTSETLRLTVADAPVEDLVLQLAAPRLVSGRIVFDGSGTNRPPPLEAIRLYAASGRGECGFSEAAVQPDLTFTMRLHGRLCQVGAGAGTGSPWRQRSVTRGSHDVTFEGVGVREPDPGGELVITFTDRGPTLRLAVSDASGARADEFIAFIFPADPDKRSTPFRGHPGLTHRTTREIEPGPPGEDLTIEGLLAGEYLVVAIHPDDYEASGAPVTWDVLEPLGQRVTLAEHDVRALSLTLVDLPDSP